MDENIKQKLQSDFEKYMRHCIQSKGQFTLMHFVPFASTLINFTNDSSIKNNQRLPKAYYLLDLYNAGLQNRITKDDADELAVLILSDPNIDFEILSILYGDKG